MDYNMDKIIERAKKGQINELLDGLSQSDSEKIRALLRDKEACERLINSPKAQKILEMLNRGGM